MSDDEISVFRHARPEVPPYEPAAKERARARLLDARTERIGRSFRLPRLTPVQGLLAVGTATAVLVAGPALLLKNLGGADRPAPAPGSARALAPGTDDRPRAGQWSYTKTVLASSSKGVGGALFGPPDRRVTNELWRSVDGRYTATMEKGRLKTVSDGSQLGMSPRADLPYLLSLPVDPAALLAQINKTVDQEVDQENGPTRIGAAERAGRAFDIIEIYMRDAALPHKLRQALHTVLQRLPGVRYEAKAADILGRPGVTFYRIAEGYLRDEIMIDPATHQYLGFRAVAIKAHVTRGDDRDLRSKKGQILGWGGLAESGFVDGPGRRP
ncbi:hypothetical protein SMC26_04665 [Actinomadura fulvescens]|uniref:CU044_5270 family protein n=1 Tax=Actinomadura fulvescens TaxID=46160 RepID=A0ABP6C262_9ACTN